MIEDLTQTISEKLSNQLTILSDEVVRDKLLGELKFLMAAFGDDLPFAVEQTILEFLLVDSSANDLQKVLGIMSSTFGVELPHSLDATDIRLQRIATSLGVDIPIAAKKGIDVVFELYKQLHSRPAIEGDKPKGSVHGSLGKLTPFVGQDYNLDSLAILSDAELENLRQIAAINAGIPGAAAGGIVPATRGGRLIRVGEGGQSEAIVPLGRGSNGVGTTINMDITVNGDVSDEGLLDTLVKGVNLAIERGEITFA